MKHIYRQKGFSIVELLLVIIIVCLLGAIGYLVYRLNIKPAATATPPVQANTLSASDAATIKSRAKYVIDYDTSASDSAKVPQQLQSAGYFTQALADSLMQQYNAAPQGLGGDLIICAQAAPDSWSYDAPQLSSDGKSVTLLITGMYGTKANKITTSWVKANTTWQEDGITCPTS